MYRRKGHTMSKAIKPLKITPYNPSMEVLRAEWTGEKLPETPVVIDTVKVGNRFVPFGKKQAKR